MTAVVASHPRPRANRLFPSAGGSPRCAVAARAVATSGACLAEMAVDEHKVGWDSWRSSLGIPGR